MLSRARSTFNFNFGHEHEGSHVSSFDPIELRLIVENPADVSDFVNKPVFKLSEPIDHPVVTQESNNFLKSCGLCRKKLNPQKDVYMYRGDESFCSDHCRSRKILIEELLEMDTSTKEIIGNARRCPTTDVQINVSGHRKGVQAGG